MEGWRPADEVPELAELLPPPVEGRKGPSDVPPDGDEGEGESDDVPSPRSEAGGREPDEDGRDGDRQRPVGGRFDIPVWGPVGGAVLLVLVASGAAWILGSGRAAIGSSSGLPTDSTGAGERGGPADGVLSADQRSVARSHRAALADSLRRLPGGDSLVATVERQGLAWTRRVGFSGMNRLPDRPLVEHAELMGKALEEAPEDLCAAVAEWRATSRQYWQLLAELRPSEMARLLEILRGGLMAVLRDRTAWPSPAPEAVNAAFAMLGERLPASSRDSLRRVLSPEATPSPAESCWAERTLYGGVPRIPDPWRAVLARAAVTSG